MGVADSSFAFHWHCSVVKIDNRDYICRIPRRNEETARVILRGFILCLFFVVRDDVAMSLG